MSIGGGRIGIYSEKFKKIAQTIGQDREALIYLTILVFLLTLGLIGPVIAPYEYNERVYSDEGELLRAEPPTTDHLLGTTSNGQDVLSRVLYGAQPTMITGLLGGSLIAIIGTSVGVTAGFMRGWVDNLLMRITDMFYSIPLIPFAIVLVGFFRLGYFTTVIIIGLVLWRGAARVIRSQVLQIRERPYVLAAQASGAGPVRIMRREIVPNILPLSILYLSLGIGYSIVVQASLAFIGIVSPFIPAWGLIVRNAYESGLMASAWWWSIPPAILISLTVLSAFMFGRKYEEFAGPESDGQDNLGGF